MSSIDQQFIEYIVKSLVSHPDAVKVDRRIDEKGVLLELTVDPEDLGRVIGKRGATAQSIRTLLRALGTKNDARYNLKIIDTGPPRDYSQRDQGSYSRSDDQSSAPPADDSSPAARDDSVSNDQPVSDQPAEEPKPPAPDESPKDSTSSASEVDMSEDEELPDKPREDSSHSDAVSRMRKELADLDDLDV